MEAPSWSLPQFSQLNPKRGFFNQHEGKEMSVYRLLISLAKTLVMCFLESQTNPQQTCMSNNRGWLRNYAIATQRNLMHNHRFENYVAIWKNACGRILSEGSTISKCVCAVSSYSRIMVTWTTYTKGCKNLKINDFVALWDSVWFTHPIPIFGFLKYANNNLQASEFGITLMLPEGDFVNRPKNSINWSSLEQSLGRHHLMLVIGNSWQHCTRVH